MKSQIHGIQIRERLVAPAWNPAAGAFVSSGVRLRHGVHFCYFVVSNKHLTLKGPWVATNEPRSTHPRFFRRHTTLNCQLLKKLGTKVASLTWS